MLKRIKNKRLLAGTLSAILLSAAAGYADELHQEDGIMTNHSTEYVRTLNRNTSTDPDAAFYNPAGLAFLAKDGLHINFSSQTYHVKKTHTLDFYAVDINGGGINPPAHLDPTTDFRGNLPEEYKAELTAPVLPGFDIVWKQDKWAVYFDIAATQAATNMTFDEGLAVMDWGSLLNLEVGGSMETGDLLSLYSRDALAIRNEMYLGITIGGAYEFVNWLSAGGGVRLIHATGNMKVQMKNVNAVYLETDGDFRIEPDTEEGELDWDLDTDTEGFGAGIILSTHFRPEGLIPVLKGLDATLRLEYYLPMELEKKTNKFIAPEGVELSGNLDIFKDGNYDPDFGPAGYQHGSGSKTLKVTYPPTINLGLSYMLLGWINLLSSAQVTLRQLVDLDGREKDFTVGYQAGFGAEFLLNEKITLSFGSLYNDPGIKPECRTEADSLLRSVAVGGGAKFGIDENLDLNIGAFYQYFVPATVYMKKTVQGSAPYVNYLNKDFKEMRYSVSIGATYRLFSSDSNSGSGFVDDKDEVKSKKKDKQVK